jgi:hypothetical protein
MARTGLILVVEWRSSAYEIPRAVKCDLQEQGTGLHECKWESEEVQKVADYVALQPMQVAGTFTIALVLAAQN